MTRLSIRTTSRTADTAPRVKPDTTSTYRIYTLCLRKKNMWLYIFYNNLNNKCPITTIFGIVSQDSANFGTKSYSRNWNAILIHFMQNLSK